MSKIRSIITSGICIVLFATLLFSNIILAQDGGSYDPWIDTNDDGIIDAVDLQALAAIYSTSGTQINKTALLLELQARIDSLNTTLLTEYYNITECDVIFVDAAGDVITGYLLVDSSTLFVDAFNHRVGIGTSKPLYKLDVAGSIRGEALDVVGNINGDTLFVDGIVMGMAEGNHIIYFYEDGLMLGEYIGWQDSADRFFVSDDVYIWGNLQTTGDIQCGGALTIPTTTRYYSISPCAWQPMHATYDFTRAGILWTTTLGTTYWYAPVNLPHGAVVTELTAWVHDNDVEDIEIVLYRKALGAGSFIMTEVSSEGSSIYNQQLSNTTISYSTIDNQNNSYYLYARLESGNNHHQLSDMRITYTIDEPLP